MRGKKAALNTAISLLEEILAVISAFILPKLILIFYGSKYNGLINSITQFLACSVLLRAGIGGVTRAALYKPLAEKNKKTVDSIVKATDIFMKKVGLILALAIFLFAIIYPLLIKDEFEYFFTFSLFIIMGLGTFSESFFGITYLIVLQADQKTWINSGLTCFIYIFNTLLSSLLIVNGASIHIVKMGSAFIFLIKPILLKMYVINKYKIDYTVKEDNSAIEQRWDAFWQQIAVFVMNNTDIVILTLFTSMLEVSVYSVYNLIINGLKSIMQALSSGLEAAFGNMIANKEYQQLKTNMSIVETLFFTISTIINICLSVLVLDFVNIYVKDIDDVNYLRPVFASILVVANFFNGIRWPYQLLVQAVGHYKQTKKVAMLEPIINIVLSIGLVIIWGINGVAIGTLIAIIFRTIQFASYIDKNILHRSYFIFIFRCILSGVESLIGIVIMNKFYNMAVENFYYWIIKAVIVGIISSGLVLGMNYIVFRNDFKAIVKKMKIMFGCR